MKSATYISRLVSKAETIPWSNFLPPTFPQSLHESLRNWSVHPRAPFNFDRRWRGVEASDYPSIDFYLLPTRESICQALEVFASFGEKIGKWAACALDITFAADPAEKWGFEHHVSLTWWRCRLDEPSVCWFSFQWKNSDETDAQAQADLWNEWTRRFEVPVEFFVSGGNLMRKVIESEAVIKLAQRKGPVPGVEIVADAKTSFGCPIEHPPLSKWFDALLDILDSRSNELRNVAIRLWHYDLPQGMTRETAMQRLLAEALPHISGTIWNDWTINGFITKLEGLETLQAYSGPDDQHTVELGKITIKKGGQADLFLLVEQAGFRLAVESKKALASEIFDQLERESGFTFYRTPARERPAPTSYTLREKHYLPPEGANDDPGPEVPFDLQKWTKEFHRSQKMTKPKPSARSAKK